MTIDASEARRQLLVKCWMTHDAMWFRHAIEACGIEKANAINLAAVQSMATVEIRRIQKALGIAEVKSPDALRRLVDGAWGIIGGDFMEFGLSWPSPDLLRWEVRRCFAFEGVTQLGVVARYQCGIYPRVEAWFDAVGVRWTVAPKFEGCLMHREGHCGREYRFDFAARP